MHTPVSRTAQPSVIGHVIGATSGAALAVLTSVFVGAPFGRPVGFVVASGLTGLASSRLVGDRIRRSRWAAIVGVVMWLALISSALVFVVAAIALSNFE